jgi:hypothetical protein
MTTSTAQKIPWAKLPQQIRDILAAEETVTTLEAIGAKYGLSDMEQGFLIRITSKLISGTILPTEFIKQILENIDINRDQAILVAQEINRDILNEIKDVLMELNEQKEAKPVSSQPPPPIGLVPAPPVVNVPKGPPPPAPVLPVQPPPVVRPAGEPVRSDWGWHGTKNEVTGKIEFRHEKAPQDTIAGALHVGSIFEQKLGGAFTIKSEQAPAALHPEPAPVPPQPKKAPTLHVPKKPTQVPIPPVQVFQQPK